MRYSIITTCKGRLEYLRRSLPSFLAQINSEVIVVDFDCPQGTAAVVETEFPQARVVHILNEPEFLPSVARNAGAKAARGEILVFIDSDIVLRDDFTRRIQEMPLGSFGEFFGPNDVRGTCVVPRMAFERIGGYDELIKGYGGEDLDLYARLILAGLARELLDLAYIREIIPNTPRERISFNDLGRRIGFIRGQVYREIKLLLLKFESSFELDLRFRKELWRNVDALIRSPNIFQHEHTLEVPLPNPDRGPFFENCSLNRSIRISIKLSKDKSEQYAD